MSKVAKRKNNIRNLLLLRSRLPLRLDRQVVNHVLYKPLERVVLDELFVNLGVVFQQDLHLLAWRLVLRHAGGVEGVLFGVLVAGVGLHSGRNLFSDLFHQSVGAGEQRTKAVVNSFQNAAQAVQLRLGDYCAGRAVVSCGSKATCEGAEQETATLSATAKVRFWRRRVSCSRRTWAKWTSRTSSIHKRASEDFPWTCPSHCE